MTKQLLDLAHRSSVPLYGQVASLMRTRIEHGEWAVGAQMPTVDDLAREYGVARITIRQALDDLAGQSLISRGRGRGTFVARSLADERWYRLPATWNDLLRTGEGLTRKLLDSESASGAGLIEPEDGLMAESYQRIRRVHSRDDVPYCLIDIYLASDIFEQAPQEFETHLILPMLAERFNEHLASASQSLVVASADMRAALHLDIPVGSAIARVRRVVLDHGGRVIHLAHISYPSRFVRLEMDLGINNKQERGALNEHTK